MIGRITLKSLHPLLGLQEPWKIDDLVIDTEAMSITVIVAAKKRGRANLHCPKCGAQSPYNDSQKRRWRHINVGEYNT